MTSKAYFDEHGGCAMPSFVNGKPRLKNESKTQIEKRVLAAEKTVVSSIMHRWREEWGMRFALVVINEDDTVFQRFSDKEPRLELAVLDLLCQLSPNFPCAGCVTRPK